MLMASSMGRDYKAMLWERIDIGEAQSHLSSKAEKPLASQILALQQLGPDPQLFCHNQISMYIALQAVQDGRFFVHHELRGYIPPTEEQKPEVSVWEYETYTPLWIQGVRKNPKHFCFRLDAVCPTFHPNYRSKWPAHELLHSLCGFYWNPNQTRFACYLGARIAELLPLTHWYGLDEVWRTRCPKHHAIPPQKEFCVECEKGFSSFWENTWDQQQAIHTQKALEFASLFYEEELEACIKELESKRLCPVARPLLDTSSDALGYLEGHWNRLCSWSFGAYVDLFVAEKDRHTSLQGFLQHIETVRLSLYQLPDIVLDAERAAENRKLRTLQDIGKRLLSVLEWMSDDAREEMWPLLMEAADHIHDRQPFELSVWQEEVHNRLLSLDVSDQLYSAFSQRGTIQDHGHTVLEEGLQHCFVEKHLSEKEIQTLASSRDFWSLGTLWNRAPRSFEQDVLHLEGWLKDLPHEDVSARLFGMPYAEEEGSLVLNSTFRRGCFSLVSLEKVLGWSHAGEILCFWTQGEPMVLVVDAELSSCIADVQQHGRSSSSLIPELVQIGLLVWLPQSES